MDAPQVQVFSRPGSSGPNAPQEPTRKSPIAWRKISLIATPLVLGIINLIDAHVDKITAFKVGREKYDQLVGAGQERKRLAEEAGESVGRKRKQGIIDEAHQQAQGEVAGSRNKAALTEEQGNLADPVIRMASEATYNMAGPIHEMGQNVLHITRLALLKREGIEIAVTPLLANVQYKGRVGHRVDVEAERGHRIGEAGRLVERASLAWDADVAHHRTSWSTYKRCGND